MKRVFNIFALAATVVLMAVSCSVKENPEICISSSAPEQTLRASTEIPDYGTKVFADENLRVCWNENDRISVFDRLTFNNQYVFADTPGLPYGDFNLVPEEAFYTGNELPYVYAVYPYSENNFIGFAENGNWILANIPGTQKYEPDSFDRNANAMVSATDSYDLKFKNIGGYLMLKLYGKDVTVSSITLKSNNEERLCGYEYVTIEPGEEPVEQRYYNSGSAITLVCDSPVTVGSTPEEATAFWFVVSPVEMESGFSVSVTLDSGFSVKAKRNGSVTINRNTLTRMAALEIVNPEPQYLLNPSTGEPAVFTLNESFWGAVITANLLYIESDDIRYCSFVSNVEGVGVFGDDVDTRMNFRWYINENNKEGNNFVEVTKNYMGYDYNDWEPKPETEAVSPIYCYDWMWYYMSEQGFDPGVSWLELARIYGEPDGEYPMGYYDGKGSFYFNLRYYVPGLGGWKAPVYDFVATAEGF